MSSFSASRMRTALPRSFAHFLVKVVPYIFGIVCFLYVITWHWESIRYERVTRFNELYNNADEKWTQNFPPANKPRDAVWQPVGDTRYRFYVYSAYVEYRKVAVVRIIAASRANRKDPVVCRIWLSNNRTFVLKAKVKPIKDDEKLSYSASFVLCLLDEYRIQPQETVGASISVLAASAPNQPATNMLTVLDTEPNSGIEEQLHVCVKPFQYAYAQKEWLLEWLELNRLVGVTHFYMYKGSLSSSVSQLLDHYHKIGLVTLLTWNLPIVSIIAIKNQGMFAAFNDCLYRSMSSAGWLLVIDADEIVLPRHGLTLLDLLTELRKPYKSPSKEPAAFLFNNAFFYVKWQDDPKGIASLVTSSKTRRSTVFNLNQTRYVVRPRNVLELGRNVVHDALFQIVPNDTALLHHYKDDCDFDNMNCLADPVTIDRTAHQWTEELFKRIENEKKNL